MLQQDALLFELARNILLPEKGRSLQLTCQLLKTEFEVICIFSFFDPPFAMRFVLRFVLREVVSDLRVHDICGDGKVNPTRGMWER